MHRENLRHRMLATVLVLTIIASLAAADLFTSCGLSTASQSRIVFGVDAKPGAWPWMASIQYEDTHWCGAALLSPMWVITASHCVETLPNLDRWSIKLGSHNHNEKEASVQSIGIKRAILHPSYSKKSMFADIALIELNRPALVTSRVSPICLPKQKVYPSIGTNCFIAGWGSLSHPAPVHNVLQQAKLPIVPAIHCRFQRESICAGYGTWNKANACRGDSGGPLMCQQNDGSWQLDGIGSFVVTYCKYYTAFAPVNKYLDWINSYVFPQN